MALTLALRIGNRSKPSLELTRHLREKVISGKGKHQKTAKEMRLCGTDVLTLMKAQTTVVGRAILRERHRKGSWPQSTKY